MGRCHRAAIPKYVLPLPFIQSILKCCVLTSADNHPKHQLQPYPHHDHEIQHAHNNEYNLSQTNYYPFQPHSLLLAKLSPELRLLIWEYVLGGKCIHIVQWANRRMGYVVCTDSDGNGNKNTHKVKGKVCDVCQTGLPSRRACAKRGTDTGVRGLLGVMLVCRQMYARLPYPLIYGYILMRKQIHRSRTHPLHKQRLYNPLDLVPSLSPLLTLLPVKPIVQHPHPDPPLRLSWPLAPQQRPRETNILHLRPRAVDTNLRYCMLTHKS